MWLHQLTSERQTLPLFSLPASPFFGLRVFVVCLSARKTVCRLRAPDVSVTLLRTMNSRSFMTPVALLLALTFEQSATQTNRGTALPATAKGTFDAKVTPLPAAEGDDPSFTRFTVEKQFHGDMEGTGKVHMLAAGTAIKDSGGYVALEKVSATLAGRKGTFVLQHMGSMKGGAFNLNIAVVPDSGTDQLAGIPGKFVIEIKDGKHFYTFDYALPPAN